ncbi:branched-chain amino acid ABC transporter permease [Pseudonocardia sp. GCM10023141]|uniref:branched-chain amino acid ABC transporter permease n=1 Tax=Pseudonocardia sp. GCM10023141 TaxID=3252653 RepID=UPI00361C1620
MADYLRDAIVLGGVYTVFALGLTLSWGVLNVLNLAHGNVLVAAALTGYLLSDAGMPFAALLPLCILAGAVLGALLEIAVFRPIRARARSTEAAGLAILIGSIAAGSVLFAAAEEITDGRVRTIGTGTFDIVSFPFLGTTVTTLQVLIVALSLVLGLGLAVFVRRSRTGHALRALAHDPATCGLLGISAGRLGVATMAVAGGLAGAAGLLLALHIGSVEASMTESLLLKAFAVIVLGGVGSIGGAVVGAYLIAGVEVGTVALLGSGAREAVVFAIILVLLLVRPQGLFARTTWQRA